MPSRRSEWTFTEAERDDVCNGKFCPRCKSAHTECRGAVPDGVHLNASYHCKDCDESWEGY